MRIVKLRALGACALALVLAATTGCIRGQPAPQEPTGAPGTGGPAPQPGGIIGWILSVSPGSPTGPDGTYGASYLALGKRDCAAARQAATGFEQADLYRGAAAACQAAGLDQRGGGGQQQDRLWDEARAVLNSGVAAPNCVDVEVLRLLQQLVQAHDSNPAAQIRVSEQGGGARGLPSGCPVITALQPEQGPPSQEITAVGVRLEQAQGVEVMYDTESDVVHSASLDGNTFFLPSAPDNATVACVRAILTTDWFRDLGIKRYEIVGGSPSPSAPGSPPVSPSPQGPGSPSPEGPESPMPDGPENSPVPDGPASPEALGVHMVQACPGG